ncbi:Spo0E like sporulation regulatory protein [Bacillus sp. OV166]|uniref:aspartyl-phosphate phosphatase Spo0E family protein n=1 Tax=Bacillus sp. OV166 TaxID=1882763 RepID=UPI000A2AD736|nr:aspartyl-phosphate phosphatase Spo0E family protein [Bacillus sp. OV166]SMQ75910.1 Spo0E like sporulation regulatory protein [Bacillus sp. OV166]
MNKYTLELSLLKRINVMKETLVNVAKSKGINSPETISYSQELDKLLNLHMKHVSNYDKDRISKAS